MYYTKIILNMFGISGALPLEIERPFNRLNGRRELVEPWKLPGYLYHKLAKETWRTSYIHDFYTESNPPLGQALITTPIEPFYRDPTRYDPRPGKWSKIENARSFSRLGFSSDIYDILDSTVGPATYEEYDVLYGDGENFVTYAKNTPEDTLRICYRGGMHWSQRIAAYEKRLDDLAERKGVRIEPSRPAILAENEATELADALLVMGDDHTAATFRDAGVDVPIRTIHTTHPPGYDFDPDQREYEDARTNFLWFGGTGPVLKGLDRVLDVFAGLENVNLYVCGPVENAGAFTELYDTELYHTDNIETVGWVDVRSRTFRRILKRCAYHIYPSGSEGSSGAVANCMWRGLVPIVTQEVFADTGDWGISLADAGLDTIRDAVMDAATRDPTEVRQLARNASETAKHRYDRQRYTNTIDTHLRDLLEYAGLQSR